MSSRRITALLFATTLVCVCALSTSSTAFSFTVHKTDVDPSVSQSIGEDGTARVFITVESSTNESHDEVADRRDDVVDDLNSDDINTQTFKTPDLISANVDASTLNDLKQNPDVDKITERKLVAPSLTDSTALIGAQTAWTQGSGYRGTGQKIAIIDSGVDTSHPFLSGSVITERCYVQGDDGPGGDGGCPNNLDSQTGTGAAAPCVGVNSCRHGTEVAGIAAGNTSVSGAPTGGVAPDAQIIAIQVFGVYSGSVCNPGASPCILADEADIISALTYLSGSVSDLDVVNMSLGGGSYSGSCAGESPSVTSLIASLKSTQKAAVIVASGNSSSSSTISWPACIPDAIAVGATTKSDVVASYSDSNSYVDFLAPGSSITSSVPTSLDTDGTADGYMSGSGTSFAAPHIAGMYALLRQAYPSSSVDTLTSKFTQSGVVITDSRNGLNLVRPNISQAIASSPPSNPSNVTGTTSDSAVTLTWGASTNGSNAIQEYIVYNASNQIVARLSGTTTSYSYSASDGTYTMKVQARSAGGLSGIVGSNSFTVASRYTGYSFVSSNAEIIGKGGSPSMNLSSVSLSVPAVKVAAWPNRRAGWVCTRDGGIFTFGGAAFYGAGNAFIRNTVVSCMSTPTGRGYWLITDDGGVFAFGDAGFYGAANQWVKNRIVAAFASPSGGGYTLVSNDGGVFTFGDAQNYGAANMYIKNTVIQAFGTPNGTGYWLITDDGGVFTLGSAQFWGTSNGLVKNGISAAARTPSGNGYWIISSDGGVFTYGDAQFYGAANNLGKNIVAFY